MGSRPAAAAWLGGSEMARPAKRVRGKSPAPEALPVKRGRYAITFGEVAILHVGGEDSHLIDDLFEYTREGTSTLSRRERCVPSPLGFLFGNRPIVHVFYQRPRGRRRRTLRMWTGSDL